MIATAGDPSVSVVDLQTFRLVKQVGIGAHPSAVLTSAQGREALVVLPAIGSLVVLDRDCSLAGRFRLAIELTAVRVTQDGKTLVAISGPSRQLIYANAVSGHVLHRVKLEAEPVALDLSVDDAVAVVLGAAGRVELFTAAGQRTMAQLDGQVSCARFRADGKLLLVGRTGTHSLTALNAPQLQVLAELPLAMQPQNICFTPDGGQAFVTGEGMDAVAIVFPYKTLEVEQTVLAGRDPGAMACSASPLYLFVANNSGSDISVLDVDNRKVIGILPVGQLPDYITITPDSQYALVLNAKSGDMAVIRVPAIRANRAKNGVALFTLLPVGNDPVHAAVIRW